MALSVNALGAGLLAGGNILNGLNSDTIGSSSAWENSNASSQGSSWGATYGTEASAQDILRAKEANDLQTQYMIAQMQYNSSEAEKVRAYETAMSNTAYQRQVKDLIAAGLNPILAVGTSGASTPAVAGATGGLQSAYKANSYADQRSGSQNSSQSSSHGESNSNNNAKTRTQLATLIEGIGSAAKGVAEGYTKAVMKNNSYSWEGALKN